MKTKKFNSIISKIIEGEVLVRTISTEDFDDKEGDCNYFRGEIEAEEAMEVGGILIGYTIVGSCSQSRIFAGSYMSAEEWSDPSFSVEFEVTSVYDGDGDEVYLTGKQLEKLAKAIKEKSNQ